MSDRYNQLCVLAGSDPASISAFERCPIIDYYMILNSRIQAAKPVPVKKK